MPSLMLLEIRRFDMMQFLQQDVYSSHQWPVPLQVSLIKGLFNSVWTVD